VTARGLRLRDLSRRGLSLRDVARAVALGHVGVLLLVALLGRWLGGGVDASLAQTLLTHAKAPAVFAWWCLATQNTLAILVTATLVATLVGGALGASSVYGDTGLGGLLLRGLEFLGAVPALILAGILRLAEPSGGVLALLATLTVLRTLEVAQLVRAQVLQILPSDFVEASRAMGASRRWQLRVHVLPRLLQPLAINLLMGASALVGLEAALTFTGLGLPSHVPSWGGGLAALAGSDDGAALACVAASIGSTCAALYGLAALLERRHARAPGIAARQPSGPTGPWRGAAGGLNGPDEASTGDRTGL
jgi:ABC-type dipeptide/oligopeptide/nickel transport system permease subunit